MLFFLALYRSKPIYTVVFFFHLLQKQNTQSPLLRLAAFTDGIWGKTNKILTSDSLHEDNHSLKIKCGYLARQIPP